MWRPVFLHLLAVVEYDGAVGPAVVIDQTQVWEQTDADGLQPSLIAHHKPVTVDLTHMREELQRYIWIELGDFIEKSEI